MNALRNCCLGSAPAPGAADDALVVGTGARKPRELFQPPSRALPIHFKMS
jgi:hypothetical protein